MHPVERDLRALADPEKAAFFPRFFKTGPGQYGEGDIFIGVTVPQTRSIAKKYKELPFKEVEELIKNPVHECRLAALMILVERFAKADETEREKVVNFYLKHTKWINNWDLVDLSAYKIVGAWLYDLGDVSLLDKLARSKNMWEQRIAIVSTFYFIQRKDLEHTFRIADILIAHPHDLLHKAVGWMLREAGKRDQKAEEAFLKTRYKTMPRTMLRYAIEKFDEPKRKRYLNAEI